MPEPLYADEHLVLEPWPVPQVLVLRRTDSRPAIAAELAASFERALAFGGGPPYEGWGLVIDSRQAPGRNAPEFERVLTKLREEAARRFPRVAVVLRFVAGELQARRLEAMVGGVPFLITRDPQEAIRFAAGRG